MTRRPPHLRTILVTGASRGIGADLARRAAAHGHGLVLVARSSAPLEALAAELEAAHGVAATPIALDLAGSGAVETLAARLDELGIVVDALVNNAALGASGPLHEDSPERLRTLLDLNVVTLTMLTRQLVPGMVERGRGAVLNVASVAGFTPGPGVAAYHASKAYVVSLSMAMRRELAGTGVTVSCLCPGPVDTEFPTNAGVGNVSRVQGWVELSSERVARDGYDALVKGRAVAVPGLPMKLTVHASRHTPLRALTALAGRALGASISGYGQGTRGSTRNDADS